VGARACRICNRDYGVFACGGVALSEDRLNLDRESDRSDLGRIAGQPEVTCFHPTIGILWFQTELLL
jgi:hypothetical protein